MLVVKDLYYSVFSTSFLSSLCLDHSIEPIRKVLKINSKWTKGTDTIIEAKYVYNRFFNKKRNICKNNKI